MELHKKEIIDKSETKDTLKAYDRRMREKDEWHNELVYFEIQDDNGRLVHRFKLSRRMCAADQIQSCVEEQAGDPFTVAYLMNHRTSEVVHLDEARAKCLGKPNRYILVPRRERHVYDAAGNERYEGMLALLVENVPVYDDRNEHRVGAVDLRDWIMFGLQEEDSRVKRAVGFVGVIEDEIAEIVRRMQLVPFMAIVDPKSGKPLPEKIADAQRDAKYHSLLAEKESMERRFERAKHKAQEAIAARDRTNVVLTPAEDKARVATRQTWYCSFRCADGAQLEHWAANKTDWDGIRLALGHIVDDEYLPPFAGRGSVPDGSKEYLPDYTPFAVNMQATTFRRVEHGFGIYKNVAAIKTIPFVGGRFEYFHGEFCEGKRHGRGVEYSEHGVFCGEYNGGARRGASSRMDFASGDSYHGAFGVSNYFCSVPLGTNRYAEGVLHGAGEILFTDGARYVGEFEEGRISGRGEYRSASGDVIAGTFRNGRLHGEGSVATVANGHSYCGNFRAGVYHGVGKLTTPRSVYSGPFNNGFKSGRGMEEYVDGTRYEGFYALDERHGHGVLTFDHKRTFEGQWLAGHHRSMGKLDDAYCSPGGGCSIASLASLPLKDRTATLRAGAKITKTAELDRSFRAHVAAAKLQVFTKLRKHAERIVTKDFTNQLEPSYTFFRRKLRLMRLNDLVQKQKLSTTKAYDVALTNKVRDAVRAINTQHTSGDAALIAHNALSAAIQSDFEEVLERWKTIDLEPCLEEARNTVVWQEQIRKHKEEVPLDR